MKFIKEHWLNSNTLVFSFEEDDGKPLSLMIRIGRYHELSNGDVNYVDHSLSLQTIHSLDTLLKLIRYLGLNSCTGEHLSLRRELMPLILDDINKRFEGKHVL